MATCGGDLRQLIFETPPLQEMKPTASLFDSLSPWNQLKNINPNIESSFTEIFGELHFHEKIETPLLLSPDHYCTKKHPLDPPPGYSSDHDSLQLCTEGLGLESLADVEEDFINNDDSSDHFGGGGGLKERRPETGYSRSSSMKDGGGHRVFPPPISTLGRSGKPLVYFKSYRDEGRFILREVRIPTHEFLHASRQDGRLKLQFVHPNEDIVINGGATRGDDDDDDDEHDEEMVSY